MRRIASTPRRSPSSQARSSTPSARSVRDPVNGPIASARHEQYDAYVHGEVLPMIRSRPGRSDLAVLGASSAAIMP